MQKRPDNLLAMRPVYAVISLDDLLTVEREAAAAGMQLADAVRRIVVEQLRREQATLSVH